MGELLLGYTVCEVAVAVLAITGNSVIIIAFALERRLRRVTNFYIISLAIADLLVGLLGIPSAVLTRLGLPEQAFHACLLMLSVLVLLCTVSILNLVAVTLDRYWAIIHPFCYKRKMSGRAAGGAILGCWLLGSVVGLLPLFGWNNGPQKEEKCLFIPVMNYDFLVLIFFATIVYPALLMAFCYGRIYSVVLRQLRQITALEQQQQQQPRPPVRSPPSNHTNGEGSISGSEGSLQHVSSANALSRGERFLQHANKREVRTAKNLAIIVVFFMVCWIPLYTVNCIQAFCNKCYTPSWLLDAFIVLSHANSAINPFLYAYHMSDFRLALKRHFLCAKCSKTRPQGPAELESLSAPALTKMAVKMAVNDTTNFH